MSLPTKCPLCRAEKIDQKVVTSHVYGDESGDRAFYHCNECDVRYQYPGLTVEEEANFYAAEFEAFMSVRAGDEGGWMRAEDHIIANEETRLRRMKYINQYIGESGNILEIGCSSGFMLSPLNNLGYNCIGIEPSGLFNEFVNSRGIDVYDSMKKLEQSELGCRFDTIIHFFVLEHIADPLSFLKSQLDLLKPGGKIIFEIPNAADPLYSVYDIPAFERFYWSVAHPWYFSEESLNYLLRKLSVSYEILRDQRYDLSNHMVWAKDGKPGGMGNFTDKLGVETESSYKESLIKSGNCDTLIAVISKDL
jgi:SAM-dependent methyltransferase